MPVPSLSACRTLVCDGYGANPYPLTLNSVLDFYPDNFLVTTGLLPVQKAILWDFRFDMANRKPSTGGQPAVDLETWYGLWPETVCIRQKMGV